MFAITANDIPHKHFKLFLTSIQTFFFFFSVLTVLKWRDKCIISMDNCFKRLWFPNYFDKQNILSLCDTLKNPSMNTPIFWYFCRFWFCCCQYFCYAEIWKTFMFSDLSIPQGVYSIDSILWLIKTTTGLFLKMFRSFIACTNFSRSSNFWKSHHIFRAPYI